MTGRKDRRLKLKGLKKAVGERNSWIKRGYSYIANIMLDKSTGEVWCDCFISSNSFRLYESDSIVKVNSICEKYNMPMTMMGIKISLLSEYYRGGMPLFENIEKELIDYAK